MSLRHNSDTVLDEKESENEIMDSYVTSIWHSQQKKNFPQHFLVSVYFHCDI